MFGYCRNEVGMGILLNFGMEDIVRLLEVVEDLVEVGFGVFCEEEVMVVLGVEGWLVREWVVCGLLMWEECVWGGWRFFLGVEGNINCFLIMWILVWL